MRIVYVTETFPPEVNGAALTAARAMAFLRACGHDVMLVRPRQQHEPELDAHWEWRTAGWPIPMYPALRFGWAAARDFRARWATSPPDLVHVATPGPLALAALRAVRADGIAATADFRTNFHAFCAHYRCAWAQPLVLAWLRRLHARADVTFVPTLAGRRELLAHGFDAVDVVARGVDPHRFSPAWRDEALRRRWDAGERDPVFIHVGRLAAEKNVELALRTFEHVRSRHPRARMVVVGDGPQRKRLQAAHAQVHFAGVQRGDDLARHYASGDIFLLPSRTETFGNVTLEAMASGLAVVAFPLAAAQEHVRDGSNGFLARDTTPPAFAVAALRAMAQCSPDSPARRRARTTALGLDWTSVLSHFERRLCDVAMTRALGSYAALA